MMAAVKVDDIKGGNQRPHKLHRETRDCRRHRGAVSSSIGPFCFSIFLDMFPSLGPSLTRATNVDAEKIFSQETQCLLGLAGPSLGHLLVLASFCWELCKSSCNQNWHYLVFNKSPRLNWGWFISALYSEDKLVCSELFHGNAITFSACEIAFLLV